MPLLHNLGTLTNPYRLGPLVQESVPCTTRGIKLDSTISKAWGSEREFATEIA